MVMIKPFKAYRPRKDVAHKVAALPYDVMDSDEAREIVKDNMYSFLHIDKAEVDLPKTIDIYDRRVYEKAKENLKDFIEKGILIEDSKNILYIYRLIMDRRVQTGIVACSSIDDYKNNKIKKHEKTREDKELDRINHVNICGAHTGPIFLTYRDKEEINKLVDEITSEEPNVDFLAEDGVEHIVWCVSNKDRINTLVNLFNEVPCTYIADGHHRAASAVKVGELRRDLARSYKGDEEFNYFLSVLFPSSDLKIMDYNRVVKDLNGLSPEKLLEKIEDKFEIEKAYGSFKPRENHVFGMYLNKEWYKIRAKEGTFENTVLESLDVSILQNNLLSPILGINDPRTDKRIDFVGGIRGLKELERLGDKYNGVAFALYPTTIDELMSIADNGEVMPPKSTWFEPKLRSGLFIHKLD